MIKIFILFFYHVGLIALSLFLYFSKFLENIFVNINTLWLEVVIWGLLGGCAYCIRGLYLQYCVKKEWDDRWIVWHIIRPTMSAICGAVSLLFIQSGFLLFAGSLSTQKSYYAVYAVAFIAGLNVDNFMNRIESLMKASIGIEKTRASKN